MGKIITNLRKRIKEKGYTREQFADMCGIPEETLKKYLSKDDYPTRWLKVFAEKLDCTYDYLLGKSKVPERKYKDARSETGLSIQAIDNIKSLSDNNMQTLNMVLEDKEILSNIDTYFRITPELNRCYVEYKNKNFIDSIPELNDRKPEELPDLYVVTEIAVRTRLENLRHIFQSKK